MRRWLEGGAIVAVALATIATSRPRWSLDAKLPPIDDPAKAHEVIVEASSPPNVWVDGGNDFTVTDLGHGKWKYFIPAGRTLRSIGISGSCSGGGFCTKSDCTIPPNELVRVVSLTAVESWRIEVDSAVQTTTVDPAKPVPPHYRIIVDSSQRVQVHIDVSDPAIAANAFGDEHTVELDLYPNSTTLQKPITVTWKAKVWIEGACADPKNCKPPDGAKLSIFDVRVVQPAVQPVTP